MFLLSVYRAQERLIFNSLCKDNASLSLFLLPTPILLTKNDVGASAWQKLVNSPLVMGAGILSHPSLLQNGIHIQSVFCDVPDSVSFEIVKLPSCIKPYGISDVITSLSITDYITNNNDFRNEKVRISNGVVGSIDVIIRIVYM